MKKFLPFENYILVTDLSMEQVKSRIAEKAQAQDTVVPKALESSTKEYEGYMYHDNFTIRKIIRYRNSFLPVINGQISTAGDKTQVRIKMQLQKFVLVFMLFWMGVAGVGCVAVVVSIIANTEDSVKAGMSPTLFIPFGMLLFGYFLVMVSFKTESSAARQFLVRLLDGKEIR